MATQFFMAPEFTHLMRLYFQILCVLALVKIGEPASICISSITIQETVAAYSGTLFTTPQIQCQTAQSTSGGWGSSTSTVTSIATNFYGSQTSVRVSGAATLRPPSGQCVLAQPGGASLDVANNGMAISCRVIFNGNNGAWISMTYATMAQAGGQCAAATSFPPWSSGPQVSFCARIAAAAAGEPCGGDGWCSSGVCRTACCASGVSWTCNTCAVSSGSCTSLPAVTTSTTTTISPTPSTTTTSPFAGWAPSTSSTTSTSSSTGWQVNGINIALSSNTTSASRKAGSSAPFGALSIASVVNCIVIGTTLLVALILLCRRCRRREKIDQGRAQPHAAGAAANVTTTMQDEMNKRRRDHHKRLEVLQRDSCQMADRLGAAVLHNVNAVTHHELPRLRLVWQYRILVLSFIERWSKKSNLTSPPAPSRRSGAITPIDEDILVHLERLQVNIQTNNTSNLDQRNANLALWWEEIIITADLIDEYQSPTPALVDLYFANDREPAACLKLNVRPRQRNQADGSIRNYVQLSLTPHRYYAGGQVQHFLHNRLGLYNEQLANPISLGIRKRGKLYFSSTVFFTGRAGLTQKADRIEVPWHCWSTRARLLWAEPASVIAAAANTEARLTTGDNFTHSYDMTSSNHGNTNYHQLQAAALAQCSSDATIFDERALPSYLADDSAHVKESCCSMPGVSRLPSEIREYKIFYSIFFIGFLATLVSHLYYIDSGSVGYFTFLPVPPQYDLASVPLQARLLPIVYGFMHANLYVLGFLPLAFMHNIQRFFSWFRLCRYLLPLNNMVFFHRLCGVLLFVGLMLAACLWATMMCLVCGGYPAGQVSTDAQARACLAFSPNVQDISATTMIDNQTITNTVTLSLVYFDISFSSYSIPGASYFDPRDNVLFLRQCVWVSWACLLTIILIREGPAPTSSWLPTYVKHNFWEVCTAAHKYVGWLTLLLAFYARIEVFYVVVPAWGLLLLDHLWSYAVSSTSATIVHCKRITSSNDGRPYVIDLLFLLKSPFGHAGSVVDVQIPAIDRSNHPFSIVSCGSITVERDGRQIELPTIRILVRIHGDLALDVTSAGGQSWKATSGTWTGALFELLQRRRFRDTDDIRVRLQGPYGSAFTRVFDDSFDVAVVSGTGTGIAGVLSVVMKIASLKVQASQTRGKGAPKFVWLVWSCSNADELLLCYLTMMEMFQDAKHSRAFQTDGSFSSESLLAGGWLGVKLYVSQAAHDIRQQNAVNTFLSNEWAVARDEVRTSGVGEAEPIQGGDGDGVEAGGRINGNDRGRRSGSRRFYPTGGSRAQANTAPASADPNDRRREGGIFRQTLLSNSNAIFLPTPQATADIEIDDEFEGPDQETRTEHTGTVTQAAHVDDEAAEREPCSKPTSGANRWLRSLRRFFGMPVANSNYTTDKQPVPPTMGFRDAASAIMTETNMDEEDSNSLPPPYTYLEVAPDEEGAPEYSAPQPERFNANAGRAQHARYNGVGGYSGDRRGAERDSMAHDFMARPPHHAAIASAEQQPIPVAQLRQWLTRQVLLRRMDSRDAHIRQALRFMRSHARLQLHRDDLRMGVFFCGSASAAGMLRQAVQGLAKEGDLEFVTLSQ